VAVVQLLQTSMAADSSRWRMPASQQPGLAPLLLLLLLYEVGAEASQAL
jgi:hypothetical protein